MMCKGLVWGRTLNILPQKRSSLFQKEAHHNCMYTVCSGDIGRSQVHESIVAEPDRVRLLRGMYTRDMNYEKSTFRTTKDQVHYRRRPIISTCTRCVLDREYVVMIQKILIY